MFMPQNIIPRVFIVGLSFALLAGCASAPEATATPGLTFQHLRPVAVNARNIQTNVNPGPEVDGFVVSPYNAAENYIQSRFRADGAKDTLRTSFEKVGVTHTHEGAKNKIAGYLDVAGFDVYKVDLFLRLEHVSETGTVLYGNTIHAARVMKITEHASIAEREKHQLEGLEILFKDLDEQVKTVVLEDMRIGATR